MDAYPPDYFADLIRTAQALFAQVSVEVEATPARARLKIQARYGHYRIFVTELTHGVTRKYSYYVLRENYVEAGFDNSPDPRAIRLKYGQIGAAHTGELVPHLHRNDKNDLFLTDEIKFSDFIAWLKEHLRLEQDLQ